MPKQGEGFGMQTDSRNSVPIEQVRTHLLELVAADGGINVLGAISCGCDKRQADAGRCQVGQLYLCLFCCLCQPLQRL